MCQCKRGAFTLIELLVVIAVIGVLLAILVPSLAAAKELATSIICLSNQKNLSAAWHLYQANYKGFLVGGSTYYTNADGTPYRWVEPPLYKDTDNPETTAIPSSSDICLKYRLNGIRAGRLFTYIGSEKVYHCPNDKTMVKYQEPYAVYRTYAIAGLMNSEDFITRTSLYGSITQYRTVTMPNGTTKELKVAVKFSDIKNPGRKYVFVEEDVVAAKEGNSPQIYNQGGFVLMNGSPGSYWTWWDTMAYCHNDASTLGFSDGHAEKHRWQDRRTIDWMKKTPGVSALQTNNPDMEWMNQGYLPQ